MANNTYHERLIELINETKQLKNGQIHIIYLDKNHHPKDGVKGVVDSIEKYMPPRVQYTKAFMLPAITKKAMKELHFSYEYMAQVFANAIKRDDHETLNNSDIPKVFNIIWIFLGFSKRIMFNK